MPISKCIFSGKAILIFLCIFMRASSTVSHTCFWHRRENGSSIEVEFFVQNVSCMYKIKVNQLSVENTHVKMGTTSKTTQGRSDQGRFNFKLAIAKSCSTFTPLEQKMPFLEKKSGPSDSTSNPVYKMQSIPYRITLVNTLTN